jgi:hypothetical protein
VRCHYCGKSPGWFARAFTSVDFCSREHRDAYHERLRKVAGSLSEYQSVPAAGVGAAVAAAVSVTQQEFGSLPGGQLVPVIECVPAISPSGETARDREQTFDEIQAPAAPEPGLAEIMREADTTGASPALSGGLRPREFVPVRVGDGANGSGFWLPIPVLPAAGAAPSVQSVTAMLSPAIENYAQIKRWGLKIKFLRA